MVLNASKPFWRQQSTLGRIDDVYNQPNIKHAQTLDIGTHSLSQVRQSKRCNLLSA